MHSKPSTLFIVLLRWNAEHQVAALLVATIVWTAVMLPFVHDFWIAAVCGLAFGIVLTRTLPRPPHDSGS